MAASLTPSGLMIRQAPLVLPGKPLMSGDVLVHQGKIVEVGPHLTAIADPDTKEIDATDLTLLPGVIVPQMHFREPSLEHKDSALGWLCPRLAGAHSQPRAF